MGNQPVLTDRMPKPEAVSGTQRMPGAPEKKPVPETDYTGGSLAKGEAIAGYAVESKLSSNTGESEIYIVSKDGTQCILKYYYPNFQPKHEILEKLKNLNHEDIVDVIEYGTYKDRFYEIMDYAHGGTLADKTAEGMYKYLPMPEDKVSQVVKEVANAFKFCHEKGIIHRDIKPGNLFFKNADGTDVIIGDFGISSALDVEGKMSKRMTTTSRTEGYAAPEIYSGVLGPEVDYYALGITVFELLTGKNPFDGRNNMHIMRDTIEGRVIEDFITRPAAKDFSLKIKKLLQGLLTVRHEKRWGYAEVNRWLRGEEVPVFQNVVTTIPPFQLGDKNITSCEEMAEAITQDKETAKKLLYRGMIERWAEGFDKNLALKIGDIKEANSSSQSFGVQQLIYLFDPARPCSKEYPIKSLKDFQGMLIEDIEKMANILRDERSELHAWFIQHGLGELSGLCINAANTSKSNKRLINTILLSFQENSFKPFVDDLGLEIISVEQLQNIQTNYHPRIVQELGDPDSMLSIWLQGKLDRSATKALDAWLLSDLEKNWAEFINITKGKCQAEYELYNTAREHFKAKRYDDAIIVLRGIIEQKPEVKLVYAAYIQTGMSYHEKEEFESAIGAFSEAMKLCKNNDRAWYCRGDTYSRMDQRDKAYADYSKAIEINPQNSSSWGKRAFLHECSKRYNEAVADYNRAIQINPQDPNLYLSRGGAYGSLGKHDAAISDMSKVIDMQPEPGNIMMGYMCRSELYGSAGNYDKEVADCDKMMEMCVKYNQLWMRSFKQRAYAYQRKGEIKKAIDDCKQLIELIPDKASSLYFVMGNIYFKAKKFDEAITNFTKALELIDNAFYYASRGNAYLRINDLNKAFDDFNVAIEKDQNCSEAYNGRGNVLFAKGWLYESKAIADFNKAIEINSDYADAYYNRGRFYYKRKNREQAKADYTKARELNSAGEYLYYDQL